jgi:hypothetical protein
MARRYAHVGVSNMRDTMASLPTPVAPVVPAPTVMENADATDANTQTTGLDAIRRRALGLLAHRVSVPSGAGITPALDAAAASVADIRPRVWGAAATPGQFVMPHPALSTPMQIAARMRAIEGMFSCFTRPLVSGPVRKAGSN